MAYDIPEKRDRCLECGGDLDIESRSDRKFCCTKCRSRYHNRIMRETRLMHNRVITCLHKNYVILDGLLKDGIRKIELGDLSLRGFDPAFSTGSVRLRYRTVFFCYEICYSVRGGKLLNLHRVSFKKTPVQDDGPYI